MVCEIVLVTSGVNPHPEPLLPAKKKVLRVSWFGNLLSSCTQGCRKHPFASLWQARGALASPSPGDSLSLCCVIPRKGGAAAARPSMVTRESSRIQASQWYFGGAESPALALLTLVDLPWSSKAIHCSGWGVVTSEFLAAFSYPQNPFV